MLAVSVATALMMTGQGIISPVLPLFARELGVGVAAVGATVSAFALSRLVLNVPVGLLADRRGRRLLLVGGPLVYSAGMLGAGFSADIVSLVLWRLVQGAGSAVYMSGAMIYVADISTSRNRARLLGVNQGAVLFGVSVGPGLGGFIAEHLGLRAPFFVVAGAGIVTFLYSWLRLEETMPTATAPEAERPPLLELGRRRSAWGALLASPAFLAVALVNLTVFLTRATARSTLLPIVGVDRFGLSVGEVGVLLTVMAAANMLLLPPASMAADRFGRGRVIVPSLLGTVVALLLFAVAADLSTFLWGAAVLALATSVSGPAPAAFAADVAQGETRGLALGVFRTFGDLGLLIGPTALGGIAEVAGFGWAFAVNALLVVVTVVVFALARPGRVHGSRSMAHP